MESFEARLALRRLRRAVEQQTKYMNDKDPRYDPLEHERLRRQVEEFRKKVDAWRNL